jgi:protein-S-isoprenylcysteine O-methyltransferase Ste14
MEFIGKTSINPFLFYSGKLSGYFTWIVLVLSLFDVNIVDRNYVGINDYISLILCISGLFLTIFSLINLGRSTRLGLPSSNTVLKTYGLYRITRNPMYLGFNLLTISSVIFMINPVIAVLGIYSLITYHHIILAEEKFLEQRFGNDYLIYKDRVRRYI